MRSLLLMAALSALLLGGCEEPPVTYNEFEIEPKSFVDLGLHPAGSQEKELTFTNRSGRTLSMERLTASCTCAGLDMSADGAWPDGESRTCLVKMRVSPGKRNVATVKIDFTDHAPVTAVVAVTGEDLEGISGPAVVDLGDVEAGVPTRFDVPVEVASEAREYIEAEGNPALKWSIAEGAPIILVESEPGRVHAAQLPLTATATFELSTLLPGRSKATLRARLGRIFYSVDVAWNAVQPLRVEPSVPVLRAAEGRLECQVQCRLVAGMRFVSATCEDESVAVHATTAGQSVTLDMTAPDTWESADGLAKVMVLVESEDGTVRTFAVPLVRGI